MARLCPLFSGSSGNSYYIGNQTDGILIDVGRSARQTVQMLDSCGIAVSQIKGIFITHEHSDHVKGLRVFASKYHIKVYASPGTLGALEQMGILTDQYPAEEIGLEGIECGGMMVKPFLTSHDCAQGYGYTVQTSDDRKITVSTDLGVVSDHVREHLCGSDMVVLESNHDVGMLRNGSYPYPLKRRILSDLGHLSNQSCAEEISALVKGGTPRFLLAHLSRENNTPEIAYQTAICALTMEGMKPELDFQLGIAPVENRTGKTIIF